VAGTITALTNNGRGGAGVTWGPGGARIMPLRVVGVDGLATFADIAEAVTYATDRGAQVINISLGAPQGSQLLQDAVTYASSRGVLIVAAAGNGGCTGETGAIDFPAAYPQVVAVGAVTFSNLRSSFSDCGPELDVVAPGGSGAPVESETRDWIWAPSWSPEAGHAYFGMVGTSMAAPHVAGLAALLIARGTVGAEALRSRLQGTAQDLGLPGFDTEYGHGKVRADLAVTAPVMAFAADIDGTRIRVRSSRVVVLSTGAFRIPNVVPGDRWVVVWQDVNVNGAVDAGDVFGVSSAPVVVIAGQETTNVAITVGPRGPLDPVLAVDG
jgi:serine protease